MWWRTKNVLVTGGFGFIGSHLVEKLVEQEARVTVIDNLRNGNICSVNPATFAQVQFINRDIESDQIKQLLSGAPFDVIYYLGSSANVPGSVSIPLDDFESNLGSTLRFLELLRSIQYKGIFIYPSSAAVYGNPRKLPISEEDLTIPISPYGVSKLAAERYLYVYSQLYGIKGASIRSFSVYGPSQTKLIVYDIISQLYKDPYKLVLLGNGQQTRDFIYIQDVIKAFLLVAEKGNLVGETYNLGSGSATTIELLALTIAKIMHSIPEISYKAGIPSGRLGDPDKWIADIAEICKLGFSVEYELEDGLHETIAWFNRMYPLRVQGHI